jgi:hypothetical protein
MYGYMTEKYGADYNPKKIEKQMRSLVSKEEGYVCLFTNLNVIDIKQRTYRYQHQDYMLQFQETSRVQRLNSNKTEHPKVWLQLLPFSDAVVKGCTIEATHRYKIQINTCSAFVSMIYSLKQSPHKRSTTYDMALLFRFNWCHYSCWTT